MRADVAEDRERLDLEDTCRAIGQAIRAAVNQAAPHGGLGFALVLFDFGDAGNMAYVANGDRRGVIATLEELLANLKADTVARGVRS